MRTRPPTAWSHGGRGDWVASRASGARTTGPRRRAARSPRAPGQTRRRTPSAPAPSPRDRPGAGCRPRGRHSGKRARSRAGSSTTLIAVAPSLVGHTVPGVVVHRRLRPHWARQRRCCFRGRGRWMTPCRTVGRPPRWDLRACLQDALGRLWSACSRPTARRTAQRSSGIPQCSGSGAVLQMICSSASVRRAGGARRRAEARIRTACPWRASALGGSCLSSTATEATATRWPLWFKRSCLRRHW
mmetsp:Transcript_131822/g.381253  ORF Transcript_131822/g.381253 Transcript_131822/m.381253 type:complete len:244 (-) Transcript_131822:835-1566(-)